MEELLQKLILKVYQINKNTKHDVLLDYYGKTGNIEIYLYRNGRNASKELEKFGHIDLECTDTEKAKELLVNLEKLEKGEDNNVQ